MQNEKINDVPFGVLFNNVPIDVINKGKVGQLLDIFLGLQNGNNLLDFEDGDLKTNKAKINGLPKETMFITQVSSQIDDLLNGIKFEDSRLFKKISRLIYLSVVKMGTLLNVFLKS